MNSRFKTWNKPKWVARGVFIIFFIIAILTLLIEPKFFDAHANPILVIITGIYVYLTYEILRASQQSQVMPYINVEFILINKMDKAFTEKYSRFLRRTERLAQLQQDLKREDYTMNAVLVKVENIGETTAVDINFSTDYEKKSFSEVSKAAKHISFGVLKKGDSAVDIVDLFQSPSSTDYFNVKNCAVQFNDINRQRVNESPMKIDFSESSKVNIIHADIPLVFSLKT